MSFFKSLKDIFGGEVFTSTDGVPQGKVAGLVGDLLGKAPLKHAHEMTDILWLSAALDEKASIFHDHGIGEVAGLNEALIELFGLGLPPGTILDFAGDIPPEGYLECNGAELSRTAYPELFNIIGTLYGSSGSTTFKLPDRRGEFVRGWDHGRGIDANRILGSLQSDAVQQAADQGIAISGQLAFGADGNVAISPQVSIATGNFSGSSAATISGVTAKIGGWNASGALSGRKNVVNLNYSKTIDPDAGRRFSTETRPRNMSTLFIIKY